MNRIDKLRKNWTILFSKIEYELVAKAHIKSELFNDKKIIGVPLHLQPEASIDNMARYFENQYANIYDVSRSLPEDYCLLIKEHEIAKGRRNLGFYLKLVQLENVFILKNKLSGPEFISKIDIVFTLTGTMGLEAALIGKPVLTFVDNQYSFLPNVHVINKTMLRNKFLWSRMIMHDKNKIEDYYKIFTKNCFEGEINDPLLSISVMSERNISILVSAFEHVINDFES
jgi:hypothetical protein